MKRYLFTKHSRILGIYKITFSKMAKKKKHLADLNSEKYKFLQTNYTFIQIRKTLLIPQKLISACNSSVMDDTDTLH